MPEPVLIGVIFLIGFIPGFFSAAMLRKARSRIQKRSNRMTYPTTIQLAKNHRCQDAMDYRYVEGIGYMVGDLTCQYNARSAYIRCAINPTGPCQGCNYYESIELN